MTVSREMITRLSGALAPSGSSHGQMCMRMCTCSCPPAGEADGAAYALGMSG